jgi:hypothetical protein
MNDVALPCPWGNAIVDLDPLLLTPEQKIWLGMELLSPARFGTAIWFEGQTAQ